MTCKTLYLLCGLALIVGGLLNATSEFLHPADPTGETMAHYVQMNAPVHVLLFIGTLVVMAGLAGVYGRHHDQMGYLGFAGFLLLFFGIAWLYLVHSVIMFTVLPLLTAQLPGPQVYDLLGGEQSGAWLIFEIASKPMTVVGLLLLAIPMLRAPRLLRWSAWLMVFSAVLGFCLFLPFMPDFFITVGGVLFGLSFVGLGAALLIEQRTAPQTTLSGDPPAGQPVQAF